MSSTNLHGPYNLTKDEINRVVKGIGAGAYALGSLNSKGDFVVKRIGRSDTDLNQRLQTYVGKYLIFKYAFYPTQKAAFEKECTLYHDFKPQDNVIHPDKPNGTNYTCPKALCLR